MKCPLLTSLLSFALLVLLGVPGYAQLITQIPASVEEMVKTEFSAEKMELSNITYKGYSNAIGSFQVTGNESLGIQRGIVLSTGTVVYDSSDFGGYGPQGPNDFDAASFSNFADGDLDIALLAQDDSYDAAVLEFDFVPNSDILKFKFVFASEEYPEFVFSGWNDAFALFLSGPGYSGIYSNQAVNIAVLPNKDTVSIDNVNDSINSQYYVDNETIPGNLLRYDGYTVPIQTSAAVTPGEMYHLKIVISDIGDDSYDSAIFLEKIEEDYNVRIPNVITPNGDGTNDYFEIKNIKYLENNELIILNRWGQEVFRESDYQNKWNGDELKDGVYYYLLKSGDAIKYQGFLTLLRGAE
ncbi:MAG: gliding motility-associated C-terminal domain-containing protein [Bacteroidetes bacterium]|nr:MAG: gliding motility-associated C-terminal domain-containing protein [Bacteroidota bacterium]